jgi:predicted nucleic acid-binding Zn ribbon protein
LRYSNNIKYENIDFYTQKLIEIASDNEQLKLTSFAQKANISKYLGNYFALSNPKKALEFYKKSSKYNDSALTDELKTQQKVIDELNYLSQTYDEIKKKEEIIQKNKHTQKYLIGALILITLVLILSVLVALNYIKIKNIEKIKLQNEQDALIREQELNNRIVEYSKSIIDRNAKLRNEIMSTVDSAPSSMKNQLNQVLKDFQIAGINPIENPNIAKQLIRAKDDWNEQFPGFEELNKTEQRVFVLTMENYRPKEIANVLGFSTQYVRNVKSRLKTKLNLKEDWGN